MSFPKFSQWKQIFKVLSKSEKIIFLSLFALAFCSLVFLAASFYINSTKPAPAFGGTFTEGVVGQPRFLNPIYGETDDTDRALIDLVFSGLMTYDKNGKIVPDLVKDYSISDDSRTYSFNLKDNIFWHDGFPVTADDVIFTIKTIQNSDYKSPMRANWIDVDVEKISDKSFTLSLKTPYNSFLENCTLKIIPKHIWQNILPENFALSFYNLKPVGSGPFKFSTLSSSDTGFINSLNLISNRKYYGEPSFISAVSFKFFADKNSLAKAASQKQIDGLTLASFDNNEAQAEKEIKGSWSDNQKFAIYSFSLPRYFAVFFNAENSSQKTSLFSDSNLRQAMALSVNKDELVKQISSETKTNVLKVSSPILPDFYGYQEPTSNSDFNIETAKKLLDKSGFKDNGSGSRQKVLQKKPAFQFKSYLSAGSNNTEVVQLQACLSRLDPNFKSLLSGETNGKFGQGTGDAVTAFQQKYLPDLKPTGETGASTRQKLNELCVQQSPNSQPLKFTLVTVNQPQLVEVANSIANNWKNIGAQVDVQALDISDLKTVIKDRNYDALLYGEALGADPDFYPFWHSSQKNDPGLNLSSYESKDADKLLKDSRETSDQNFKEQDLEKLQNIIINDSPALFLYNPDYVYWVSERVQGIDTTKIIDSAKRFENITNWFIKTKRVWK